MIVLDTDVVSELMRAVPSPDVESWFRARRVDELYMTSITLAEIEYGIARLPHGQRKTSLEAAAQAVFSAFPRQVLAFDVRAARQYGQIVHDRERSGAPIDGFDAQIASICRVHEATLATRNGKDFLGTGIALVDPFDSSVEPPAG